MSSLIARRPARPTGIQITPAVSIVPPADGTLADRIETAFHDDGLTIVHQPILDLWTGSCVGCEALARFTGPPHQTPDKWFEDADRVGRRIDLELEAVRRALATASVLPPHAYLSVNASPDTILDPRLVAALGRSDLRRVVLEVTEQLPIVSYDRFTEAITPLRQRGLRLAIDDVGAGFASLKHILRLEPHILKLDRSLTADIDHSAATRALGGALTSFALETGAIVLAEGIETEAQLAVLKALGISLGQGYLLGRPAAPAPTQRGSALTVAAGSHG